MTQENKDQKIDFNVDKDSLYKEEAFTDLKVASIRRLTPVKEDGSTDEGRTPVFIGTSQVMSPSGPVPIQEVLPANSLEEAWEIFPKVIEQGLQKILMEIEKMQSQEKKQDDSRIIMPGS